ncbi:sigma-70 family RNA polymerase sigma factor [Indiicoccus explosivorum]|uniref:sigma-70 family RNA polymerase sigma factor n=1 Tax=Indiicoccus explosivorum TaxID=1917864 RepID=UPI000B43A05B|nr:sigma-70 family RNA polymerase sigma factor [Indiicoccus explosivorum]
MDEELIRKAINGQYDAFSVLVTKYSNLVYGVALSKTRDIHQSEDIAQEVFVKAWTKLPALQKGQSLPNWLLAITRNQCLDYFRKKARLQETAADRDMPEPVGASHDSVVKDLVWEALDGLEEKYRMAVILRYLSGYTAKEVGDLLQITQSAAESRLRRAKTQLKKELLNEMADSRIENKRVGTEFTEEVMWRIVPRIATIEIPVSDVKQSVEWYSQVLGLKAVYQDDHSAMLHLQGGSRIGVPTLYLVETEAPTRLRFVNSHTGITHSVVDFYIGDLEKFHGFLKSQGVKVTDLNLFPGSPHGGFGFEDPDGNALSATNVTHSGQV